MRAPEPIRNLWADAKAEVDFLLHPKKKAAQTLRTFLRYDERQVGISNFHRRRGENPTSVRIDSGDYRGDQVSMWRVGRRRVEYVRDFESGKGRTSVSVVNESASAKHPEGTIKVWANTDDTKRPSSARALRVADEEYDRILKELDPTPLPI